jgi:catechol 2,3-dioxygenase-like lactoylglutathione lyase family enzyme
MSSEQFPGRGYVPQAFTHGTLQCDDVERSRRFYVEVLGLEIAAGFNTAQYIKHPATPWYIVVLQRSPRQYLAPVNRFTLPMVRRKLSRHRGLPRIVRSASPGSDRKRQQQRFFFGDLDKNW